jgi:hypothetical protein
MATKRCEICNKDIKVAGFKKHELTAIHQKNKASEIVELPENKNTLRVVANGIKHFEHIEGFVEPQMLYDMLREKGLKDSSIHTTISMGYLRQRGTTFTKAQVNKYIVFLKDLKGEFMSEALDNNQDELPNLAELVNADIPGRIKLYVMMPLRAESWANTAITTEEEEGKNTINPETGMVTLYNGKTSEYDKFSLPENIVEFIRARPDMHNKPLTSTTRTFNRELHKYTNSCSQLIRRAFAEQTKDKMKASRILQHSDSTHRGTYIRQHAELSPKAQ